MKFRKRAIVIEAFQMTRERRDDNSEWPEWLNQAWNRDSWAKGSLFIDMTDPQRKRLAMGALDGTLRIDWNDWIIQDVKGELYACKPDVFEATYEAVDEANYQVHAEGDKSAYGDGMNLQFMP